ncbi:hypothetical protein [Rhodococcus sp. NPDC060176]|uniref:hypothetical protein n=1 Tax=Rhodococcus sp. NPDC060176 TaxID=3347062 RepID=UPI003660900D
MTFTASIRAAMDTADGLEYIDRVKAVVRQQLEELDNTAHIDDTHYFNHSAVPDFVVRWPGERGERRIYLRDSYSSIAAGDDTHYLSKAEPVLLSLEGIEDRETPSPEIHNTGPLTPLSRTLVTDVSAVEVIAGVNGTETSPLSGLVRANFIRGARGNIDHHKAELLVDGSSDIDTRLDPDGLATLISDSFVEDAAARINRTAQLIELATHATSEDLQARISLAGGALSLAELRHLLPWLLTQPQAIENTAFWRYIGTMMSFDDIERIRDDITELDISPLINANADHWEANWAYLGVSRRPVTDEPATMMPSSHNYRWSFESGRLGIDVGTQRILVAKNGRLIKARDNISAASWENLRGPLANYRLARVALHGIRRSITIDAEQSPDVRSDVEDVATSLDDRYYVTEATIRVSSTTTTNGLSDLLVDFGGSTVHARSGASIRDLTTIAGQVLNFRQPLTPDEIARVFSIDFASPPDDEQ